MYTPLEDAAGLSQYENKKVELTGEVSGTPWQHLVGFFPDYPYSEYFDVKDYQIIVYSKKQIPCQGPVLVKGTVIKIKGPSKGPSKTGENYYEHHILVDEFMCR